MAKARHCAWLRSIFFLASAFLIHIQLGVRSNEFYRVRTSSIEAISEGGKSSIAFWGGFDPRNLAVDFVRMHHNGKLDASLLNFDELVGTFGHILSELPERRLYGRDPEECTDSSQGLVLGYAEGIGVEMLAVFIGSLKRTGSRATPVIFARYFSEEESKFIHEYGGITVIAHAPEDRYQVFAEFLRKPEVVEMYGCGKVFLSDTRDVFFQRDIFSYEMERGHELYLFLEAQSHIFKNCDFNSAWMGVCFGAPFLLSIMNDNISCSGTTLGSYRGVVRYLEDMMYLIENANDDCSGLDGVDQAFHNYLMYSGQLWRAKVIANEYGPVNTLGRGELVRNTIGQVLSEGSRDVSYVVHQWDRKEAMTSQISGLFPYISHPEGG